ncbi:DUF262 domain-containing protein, partial [Thermus altitudinis]|uniref:DUF262 domain-containing protein n=1 Tax=Thermus altitudinis TaxID=2908145 RepID=UPI001FAA92AC
MPLTKGHTRLRLPDLLSRVSSHEFLIPEFQRDLVWKPEQVRELLVSLVRGDFAGVILLLEFNPTSPPFHHKAVYAVPSSPPPPLTHAYSVLDGQQRISALYYAFHHPNLPLPPKGKVVRFFLKLDPFLKGDFDEAVVVERNGSPGFKDLVDEWYRGEALPFGPISGPHPPHLITLYDLLMAPGPSAGSLLDAYLSGTSSPYAPSFGKLFGSLNSLLHYDLDAVVLSFSPGTGSSAIVSAISSVFVNVNSKGTKLTLFDLAVAHLFPLLHPIGLNLRSLWNRLPTTHPGLAGPISKDFVEPDDILRVMAMITGGSVKKATLLNHLHGVVSRLTGASPGGPVTSPADHSFSSFLDLWDEAASCLEEAYERIVKDYGALGPEWIPYGAMIVPLAALIHVERRSGAPGARDKVDCWYWHSVFYERYEKSVDTTAMADFRAVTSWILGRGGKPSWLPGSVPPGMDFKTVVDRKSALYSGVLNLIALAGARNLVYGSPRGSSLQIDHLFPKGRSKPWATHPWMESVLNATLLDESTNKAKGKKDPSDFYHADVLPGHGKTGASVRATFGSHLISPAAESSFAHGSSGAPNSVAIFEDFIREREKDVLAEIAKKLKCQPLIISTWR